MGWGRVSREVGMVLCSEAGLGTRAHVQVSGNRWSREIGAFTLKIDLAQIVALDSTLRMKVTVCSLLSSNDLSPPGVWTRSLGLLGTFSRSMN